MPNIKSAQKRVDINARQALNNKARKSRVRGAIKKVRHAIDTHEGVEQALRFGESELMKAASKGVIKRKTASRRISRLVKASRKDTTVDGIDPTKKVAGSSVKVGGAKSGAAGSRKSVAPKSSSKSSGGKASKSKTANRAGKSSKPTNR